MAKINLNHNHRVDIPTLILQNRNFDTIGMIAGAVDLTYKENFNSANEISFSIYKDIQKENCSIWDAIVDFKILYVPELKERFEISVSTAENDFTKKSVTAVSLCEAELSNIKLYHIEINTESDILNENYDENFPTVFYRNPENYNDYDWSDSKYKGKYKNYTDQKKKEVIRKSSLLHRILEKAPHYSIEKVDVSLQNIQHFFSISDTDIYSELTGEIAEAFHCLFLFDSIERKISVYDLYHTCKSCGYRGDFSEQCPECGKKEFDGQYGEDTTVLISTENLSTEINLETNKDSLKNCFYIEGGDDIMTAAIRSINPNGSQYIYNITEEMKKDMPTALSLALNKYDERYRAYKKEHSYPLTKQIVDNYNAVVDYVNKKFPIETNDANSETSKTKFKKLPTYFLKGYPATTEAMYEAIDLFGFVKDAMMPTVDTSGLGIAESMQAIINGFKSGFDGFTNEIALDNPSQAIQLTVERAIKNTAKIFYSSAYYDFDVKTTSYTKAASENSKGSWTGTFTLTSITEKDENGNKISNKSASITLFINNKMTLFIEQKIYRAMSNKNEISVYDITNIKLEEETFLEQLTFYSLQELQNLSDCFQSCLEVLLSPEIEENDTNRKILDNFKNFYTKRKKYITIEIGKRAKQLEDIKAVYYFDSKTNLTSGELYQIRKHTNDSLNFEKFIKEESKKQTSSTKLWEVFCSYRREDKYNNSNYISTGMTNAQVIEHAKELLDAAEKELYKASHTQYTLTSTMNNLLARKEFLPLADSFSVGNWIRIEIDNKIFKLRLLSYQINFDEIQSIDVEFSTAETIWTGISDIKSVIDSASSMAQSYSGVMEQMNQSKDTTDYVQSWLEDGLNATHTKFVDSENQNIVIDHHGILARAYDELKDSYSNYQLKVVGNGLYTTSDNWETIHTGIGRISYLDPETNTQIDDYGVIAKTVVGKLLLGENLGIYNSNGSIKFTGDGLSINNKDKTNSFIVNLNDDKSLVQILKGNEKQFYINQSGDVCLSGSINIGNGNFMVNTKGDITSKGTMSIANGQVVYNGKSLEVNGIIKAQASSKIGGWTITDTALYNGTLEGNNSGDSGISTVNFKRTVCEKERKDLRLAIGSNFGVSATGKLYCGNAEISGKVTGSIITGSEITGGIFKTSLTETIDGKKRTSSTIIEEGYFTNSGYNAEENRSVTISNGILDIRRKDDLFGTYFLAESWVLFKNNGGVFSVSADLNSFSTSLDTTFYADVRMEKNIYFSKDEEYFIKSNGSAKFHSLTLKDSLIPLSTKDSRLGSPDSYWRYIYTTSLRIKSGNYTEIGRINCIWEDGNSHDIITAKNDGLTCSFGWDGTDAETKEHKCDTVTEICGTTITYKSASGATAISDERMKESFKKLDEMDPVYMDLKPMAFQYKNGVSKRYHFGFGAGQVKEALEKHNFTTKDFAGFVQMSDSSENEDYCGYEDPMGLIYTEFISWNTHMIQKLYIENKELKQRLEKLESIVLKEGVDSL